MADWEFRQNGQNDHQSHKEGIMLVLTRKKGEAVYLGEDIKVRVLAVQGNRVRLGIEAPHDVDVRRGELVVEFDAHTLPPIQGLDLQGEFCDLPSGSAGNRQRGELALA
jgi:carbon storage regulator